MGCGGSKPNDVANPVASHSSSSVVHQPGEKCESLWKFGKQLGSGAYSVVFLAKHKVSSGGVCGVMTRCSRGNTLEIDRLFS
jgi:hypothetical protein